MNSVGDLSSGVGALGNSHKFGYHFSMLFKTMSRDRLRGCLPERDRDR
jgi:hypothetical protein